MAPKERFPPNNIHQCPFRQYPAIARWTAEREYVTIVVTGRGGNYSVRRGEQMPLNNQTSDLIEIAIGCRDQIKDKVHAKVEEAFA